MNIGGREIGNNFPTFIIAELSGNHSGDLERAKRLVFEASEAGVDAVKLQTYTADTITIDSSNPEFFIEGESLWLGRRLYDLYSEAYTPWEWHEELFEYARSLGLLSFSSPFDKSSVDFLEDLDVPAYKIASFELVDIPLIQYVASKGKPMIMSTGMATLGEIEEAVVAANEGGCKDLALLRCNSAYPAPVDEMDLKTIPDMMERFEIPVGLSDHTLGLSAPIASVCLGGCIIEKHLCLSRNEPGPDSEFSLEPTEMRELVKNVRETEKGLGRVRYGPSPREEGSLKHRRSIYVVDEIPKGEIVTESNVRSIRPGFGLKPKYLDKVIGKRTSKLLLKGHPLSWEDLVDE